MSGTTRRRFLQAGAAMAGGALLPPAIARALSIAPDVRSGSLQDVAHVVILMQENRSFDHYFGGLSGVRGFGDRFPLPVPGTDPQRPATVWRQPSQDGTRSLLPIALDTAAQFGLMRIQGTPHVWSDAQQAWDHGRMSAWPRAKHDHAMGHYARADLPFQYALAEAFTVCDAYHASLQTGTNPNRIMLWTGTIDGMGQGHGPAVANSHDNLPELGGHPASYTWTTYVERLQRAGVSWQVYQDMDDNFTDNPLAGFAPFRQAWRKAPGHDPQLLARGMSTRTLQDMRADVAAGTLPQVSYLIADAAHSEHPDPSSPAQGADYTARVIDILTANPDVWARTVLLVMFDENDGFFDHVPPPAPPSADAESEGGFAGASVVDTRGEYHHLPSVGNEKVDLPQYRGRPYGLGPRVPMYVVSPWSRGGWVNSQVFDHTSVIRFLEARFGVAEPNISAWRRAVCGDLLSCFDFTGAAAGPPERLPDTTALAARAAALPGKSLPVLPDQATQPVPMQARGRRRSRALPYQLTTAFDTDARQRTVRLRLQARGAAAVLHVYDLHALQAIPRRYTVADGKPLAAEWGIHDAGRYDLWLLGPNGFHRRQQGRVDVRPVQAALQARGDALMLALRNPDTQQVTVRLRPGAYAGVMPDKSLRLAPDTETVVSWSLQESAGWYDLWLEQDGARQRLAGRWETGRDGWSDPELGGPARLWVDEETDAA